MWAIRHKKTKKWVYGTDYEHPHYLKNPRKGLKCPFYADNQQYFVYANPDRSISYEQFTSFERALLFESWPQALFDYDIRGCGRDYEVVEVELKAKGE